MLCYSIAVRCGAFERDVLCRRKLESSCAGRNMPCCRWSFACCAADQHEQQKGSTSYLPLLSMHASPPTRLSWLIFFPPRPHCRRRLCGTQAPPTGRGA